MITRQNSVRAQSNRRITRGIGAKSLHNQQHNRKVSLQRQRTPQKGDCPCNCGNKSSFLLQQTIIHTQFSGLWTNGLVRSACGSSAIICLSFPAGKLNRTLEKNGTLTHESFGDVALIFYSSTPYPMPPPKKKKQQQH